MAGCSVARCEPSGNAHIIAADSRFVLQTNVVEVEKGGPLPSQGIGGTGDNGAVAPRLVPAGYTGNAGDSIVSQTLIVNATELPVPSPPPVILQVRCTMYGLNSRQFLKVYTFRFPCILLASRWLTGFPSSGSSNEPRSFLFPLSVFLNSSRGSSQTSTLPELAKILQQELRLGDYRFFTMSLCGYSSAEREYVSKIMTS